MRFSNNTRNTGYSRDDEPAKKDDFRWTYGVIVARTEKAILLEYFAEKGTIANPSTENLFFSRWLPISQIKQAFLLDFFKMHEKLDEYATHLIKVAGWLCDKHMISTIDPEVDLDEPGSAVFYYTVEEEEEFVQGKQALFVRDDNALQVWEEFKKDKINERARERREQRAMNKKQTKEPLADNTLDGEVPF